MVSNMGAPLIGQERLADSRNIARAVEIQQDLLGEKFRAVMSLEIGGGNGIQPLMAAAHLGLPVVDADTMGRAYPEAQMTSVAVGESAPLSLRALRPARHRGGRDQGAELEVDGAGQPQDLRRNGLDRLDLQSAAHRARGQGMGHPFHDDEGDRHRPASA